MKKKMTAYEKTMLFMMLEYILIALVFLVIAILKLVNVISSDNFIKSTIFNFITLVGGTWLTIDFVWAIASKRRRPRVSLLDKCIHLPLGIYLVTFDIISLANWHQDYYLGILYTDWFKFGVVIPFLYIFVAYSFEGIYHHFVPTPDMLKVKEEFEEEEREKKLEEEKKDDGQSNA